jgi:hypothetical protein
MPVFWRDIPDNQASLRTHGFGDLISYPKR